MHTSVRYKLYFGPYRTPRFQIGGKVQCEVLGEVTVYRISAARIPWPIGPRRALPVFGSLARAIRRESIVAVAYWWGVGTQTVTQWRRRLGIKGEPLGTNRLRKGYGKEEWFRKARRKAWSKARDPARREKIAAARRGKPRPPEVVAKMRLAATGRKHTKASRAKMSAERKARGVRPPWLNPAWQPWEDELLRTLPKEEVAARIGRTLSAIKNRRRMLTSLT